MRETERTSALYCCFLPSLADIIIGIFNREDFDTKACKGNLRFKDCVSLMNW